MNLSSLQNAKSIFKNQLYFYTPAMNNCKQKLKVSCERVSKSMKYLGICLIKYGKDLVPRKICNTEEANQN